MSTMRVDNITEKTSGAGVHIPGHIIQVVESTRTIWTSTATASFVSTGHSVTITPSATSSKILLIGSMNGTYTSNHNAYMQVKLYKNSSDHGWIASNYGQEHASQGYTSNYGESLSWSWLDSPSTTSATTYELFFRAPYGGTTVGYNNYAINGNNTTRSNIIAQEVAQ